MDSDERPKRRSSYHSNSGGAKLRPSKTRLVNGNLPRQKSSQNGSSNHFLYFENLNDEPLIFHLSIAQNRAQVADVPVRDGACLRISVHWSCDEFLSRRWYRWIFVPL